MEIVIRKPVKLNIESEMFREIADIDEIPIFKPYMAGIFYKSKIVADIKSPIDQSKIAGFFKPDNESVELAIENIHSKGKTQVRNLPGEKRIEIIQKIADLMEVFADDFVDVLVKNTGKTYSSARGEVEGSIDRLRRAYLDLKRMQGDFVPGDWDEHTLESEAIIKREPYGVVLAIVPFNYPLFDVVNKFVYSFLSGNAVIVKPASANPIASFCFSFIALKAGVPENALAIIPLSGRESGVLVEDSRINVISFTGSSETGKEVIKRAGIKQLVMELGGGDPAFVLEDADVETSASKIATGITSFSGQRCDAIKIVLVENSIYGDVKEKIINELSKIKVGDPRENSDIGPLIDERTAILFEKTVEDALNKGGKILVGGGRWRNYVEPTLIEIDDMETMKTTMMFQEEVFAPIALIVAFDDLDYAIKTINERKYGLDAAIFGKDINKIRKIVRLLDVGAIYINEYPRHGIGYYPFGGRKDSGIGREGIGYSIEYVTAIKTIVYNYKGKGIWEYM